MDRGGEEAQGDEAKDSGSKQELLFVNDAILPLHLLDVYVDCAAHLLPEPQVEQPRSHWEDNEDQRPVENYEVNELQAELVADDKVRGVPDHSRRAAYGGADRLGQVEGHRVQVHLLAQADGDGAYEHDARDVGQDAGHPAHGVGHDEEEDRRVALRQGRQAHGHPLEEAGDRQDVDHHHHRGKEHQRAKVDHGHDRGHGGRLVRDAHEEQRQERADKGGVAPVDLLGEDEPEGKDKEQGAEQHAVPP
mmetsp:Transcript_24646/g.77510  ORF Transcript_24646/g.77510 Transcript_24646/m.77510 type:complete len:248 (-) Transcript_24646:1011-1754(-)